MQLKNREQIEQNWASSLDAVAAHYRPILQEALDRGRPVDAIRAQYGEQMKREFWRTLAAGLVLIMMQASDEHGLALAGGSTGDVTRFALARAEAVTGKLLGNVWSDLERTRSAQEALSLTRLEGLVITETTVATSVGGEIAVANRKIASIADTWYTERDARVCQICEPLHATPRAVWAERFPMGPPAHPRCRCWIKYAGLDGGSIT